MSNRSVILERRRRFIAAAVASVGIAACGKTSTLEDNGTPTPCLSVYIPQDAGPAPSPSPCLSIVHPTTPSDEPTDASVSCDPPYFIDSAGHKHYKAQCLK